jgi:hypothetical protein
MTREERFKAKQAERQERFKAEEIARQAAIEAHHTVVYGEHEALAPGMYLGLFHGRDDPKADMDDWGAEGPVIGPIADFHVTYGGSTFRYKLAAGHPLADGDYEWLPLQGDLVQWGGKFYGDFCVFQHPEIKA